MKYFRMSYDEILYKRSYINLILLNRAIPGIKPFDEKDNNKYNEGDTVTYEDALAECDGETNGDDFFMSLM